MHKAFRPARCQGEEHFPGECVQELNPLLKEMDIPVSHNCSRLLILPIP